MAAKQRRWWVPKGAKRGENAEGPSEKLPLLIYINQTVLRSQTDYTTFKNEVLQTQTKS